MATQHTDVLGTLDDAKLSMAAWTERGDGAAVDAADSLVSLGTCSTSISTRRRPTSSAPR